MAKLTVELEKTRAELNAAKTQLESLRAELNSGVRKAEKTITDARGELEGLKAMLELEKDKAAKAKESVEEVQATADRLATEFGSEEGDTVLIRSGRERLKENLLYHQMSIKKAETDARVELNALKVELDLKKNEVFKAVNEKKIAESWLDVTKNLLYNAQNDSNVVRIQLDDLTLQLKSVQNRVEKAMTEATTAKDEASKARTELQLLKGEIASGKKQVTAKDDDAHEEADRTKDGERCRSC